MRRLEIHGRGDAASQRFLITRRAKTPLVTRFKTWEPPFRMRRHEVVPLKDRVVEKFARDLHTDRVQTGVLRSGATISIPIEAGQRIATTAAEFGPKNVRQHGETIAHRMDPGLEWESEPLSQRKVAAMIGIVQELTE